MADLERIRAAISKSCMMLSGQEIMTKRTLEAALIENLECIKQIDAAKAAVLAVDPDDDALDGILFRFWIRAASYPGGWPGRLLELLGEHGPKGRENMQPRHYRAALMALAKEKSVNLPGASNG